MISDPYGDQVRRLFASCAHAGRLEGGAEARIDDQGVRIELTGTLDDGVFAALRFRAWGCPHVIAAAEAFCMNYEGRAASELEEFSASELMQTLPVPREKLGRILVLEDAVRSLGQSGRDRPERGKEKH